MLLVTSITWMTTADTRPAGSNSSTDWANTFQDDMQAARRIILESHPGPVDALNAGFADWLDTGFEQQMALAESIDTADEYVYTMVT